MAIARVGVVGCGLMGSGIAQTAAQAGFAVTVREINEDLLQRGLDSIRRNLQRQVEKGALSQEQLEQVWGRLRGTTRLEDLAGSDLIIEAITEQLAAKKELFAALHRICPPGNDLCQ